MFKKIGFPLIAAVGLILLAIGFGVTPRTPVVYGDSAVYSPLPSTYGVAVNGKQSLYPSTSVIDTETSVASGSLTASPVYAVNLLKSYNRMVNVSFSVTTVPSSGPSMTPVVKESDDGGVTFYTVKANDGTTFAAIASTGAVTGKNFPLFGDLIEVSYGSAAGTGANWTFTVTTKQAQ